MAKQEPFNKEERLRQEMHQRKPSRLKGIVHKLAMRPKKKKKE